MQSLDLNGVHMMLLLQREVQRSHQNETDLFHRLHGASSLVQVTTIGQETRA